MQYELDSYDQYDWSIIGVDREENGYYICTDSGCSCYLPWEYYTKDSRTGPLTREQMEEEVHSLASNLYREKSHTVDEFIKEID